MNSICWSFTEPEIFQMVSAVGPDPKPIKAGNTDLFYINELWVISSMWATVIHMLFKLAECMIPRYRTKISSGSAEADGSCEVFRTRISNLISGIWEQELQASRVLEERKTKVTTESLFIWLSYVWLTPQYFSISICLLHKMNDYSHVEVCIVHLEKNCIFFIKHRLKSKPLKKIPLSISVYIYFLMLVYVLLVRIWQWEKLQYKVWKRLSYNKEILVMKNYFLFSIFS